MRFLIIGTSSSVLFYVLNNAILLAITKIFKTHSAGERAILVSSVYLVAYSIAFVYNFLLSKNWTFKKRGKETIKKESIRFFLVNTANAIGGAIFVAILDYFGIPPYISQIFFMAMQTIWTYLLYKKWVFSN